MNSRRLLLTGESRSRGQALVEFALVAPLLFIMLIGIVEAGIFVLNMETLNNATREGARYAIVHGSQSSCPTGPMPGGLPYPSGCSSDDSGERVKAAVREAAVGLASVGDLTVPTPRWTVGGSQTLPVLPSITDDPSPASGTNGRGEYVTVFAHYAYKPIIKTLFNLELIPSITLNARSTLVINY